MFSGLADFGNAWLGFMNPTSIALGLGGALLGIVVGILPGLSATLVIALLTTITIKLPANNAILVLICSYVGALYGGSRTAILLNIPGTAANAASCADGYALAQRGEAGRAIGIATSGAFMGTLFGVLCLAAFTPSLAEVALAFGAFEFFWLALFGVALSGSIVGDDPIKGWLMGALGLFVAQIGQEGLYAYDRFTFGWDQLAGGISLIPALVGAFGLAEVLTSLADPIEKKLIQVKDSVLPRFREVAQYWRTVLRSGVIGVLTGLLPGVGEDSGAWMSYAAAKATSKEKHLFGKGSIDGLMAAETGDMASIPGHIIPCLALGIPGSAPSAVLMAAMIIHGIQPGPMMMISHPHFVYEVVAMTSLATVTILIFGLFLVKPLLVILKIQAHGADADHLPALHRRRVRDGIATVRRLRDARYRHRRVLPAPSRLPDGAVRPRPRPRAAARQEPAPRPGALRRQPRAVLHPADLDGVRGGDDLRHAALRAARSRRAVRRVTGSTGAAWRSALGRKGGTDAA